MTDEINVCTKCGDEFKGKKAGAISAKKKCPPQPHKAMSEKEIKIIENDGYEFNIDEIEMITITNKLGSSFHFIPDHINSIELIPTTKDTNHDLL